MKTTVRLFTLLFIMSLCVELYAQDSEQQESRPLYLTVTTTHWNDDPNTDFSDWLETEKEYFDKVTSKNDLIMGSGVFMHYMGPDNSEVVMMNAYEKWEDIEKAEEVNQELISKAWPDEKKRQAFFEKQRTYYMPDHRDEIYQTMNFVIPVTEASDKPMVYYVRSSDLAMDGQGSPDTFREYHEKVTKNNSKLKGYYTHRHLWGGNSREMGEVFVFESLKDLEDFFNENEELVKKAWPDEAQRTAFMKEMNKNFTGKHSDLVYRNVPELMK